MAAGIYLNEDQVLKITDILSSANTDQCANGINAASQGWVLGNDYGDDYTRLVSDKHVISMKSVIEQQWEANQYALGIGTDHIGSINPDDRGVSVGATWFQIVNGSTMGTISATKTCKLTSISVNSRDINIIITNTSPNENSDNCFKINAALPSTLKMSTKFTFSLSAAGFCIYGTSMGTNPTDKWVINSASNNDIIINIGDLITETLSFQNQSNANANQIKITRNVNLTLEFSSGALYNSFTGKTNTTRLVLKKSIPVNITLKTGH